MLINQIKILMYKNNPFLKSHNKKKVKKILINKIKIHKNLKNNSKKVTFKKVKYKNKIKI